MKTASRMKSLAVLVGFAVSALPVALALAGPKNLNDLLEMPSRPTIEESFSIVQTLPPMQGIPIVQQAKGRGHVLNTKHWTKVLLDHGPTLIATLEKAYPGATWAFIGRDSQAIGDMVEAFYLSLGQSNRVQRIMVSKPSFVSVDSQTLVDFLKGHGVSLENIERRHPFIFVDTVSTGGGKQGRALLNALYSSYKKNGGDPSDLLRKLNMLGLAVSTYKGLPNSPEDLDNIIRTLEIQFSLPGKHNYGEEFSIAAYSETSDLSNEAGYEHFTGAWTGPFGEIVAHQGVLQAIPGPVSDIEIRKNILWMQSEIWKTVQTRKFRSEVVDEAKRMGYEFPLQRPRPEFIKLGRVQENLKELIEADLSANDTFVRNNSRNIDFTYSLTQLPTMSIGDFREFDNVEQTSSQYSLLQKIWEQTTEKRNVSAALPKFIEFMIDAHRARKISQADAFYMVWSILQDNVRVSNALLTSYLRIVNAMPKLSARMDEAIAHGSSTTLGVKSNLEKMKHYAKHDKTLRGEICASILKDL